MKHSQEIWFHYFWNLSRFIHVLPRGSVVRFANVGKISCNKAPNGLASPNMFNNIRHGMECLHQLLLLIGISYAKLLTNFLPMLPLIHTPWNHQKKGFPEIIESEASLMVPWERTLSKVAINILDMNPTHDWFTRMKFTHGKLFLKRPDSE